MTCVGIAGGHSLDHIVRADAGVRFNEPGGPGVYAALAAALIPDVRVALVSELPRDDTAGVRALLAEAGVDTSRCRLVAVVPCLWILDAPGGRRIVPTTVRPGEPELIDAAVDQERTAARGQDHRRRLDDVGAVLVSNPTLAELAQPPAAPVVGIDPEQLELRDHGWCYLDACAAHASVLFPSRLQLRQLGDDPLLVARDIRQRLGITVVAKLDREGAVVFDRAGGTWRIVDHAPRVVDTTGAGDALAGATIAALARGMDLPQATAIGISAARLTLSDWGTGGLRSVAPGALARPFPEIDVECVSSLEQ